MRVLLGILAVLALLVGGLAGVWWLAGPDAHRWVARQALELVLEQEIHVDGTLDVELGAEPLLQLTDLRIDNPPWAETPAQLRIAHARIQIALRPLLRRVLVLPLVELEGLTLALETAADGRNSWQSDSAPSTSSIPLLDRVSISDATITYHDRRDDQRTRVHIASLTDHRDDAAGNMRLDANGNIDGRPFRIGGTSGTLETALAATDPWPLDLALQLPSLDAKLAGTVADLARATGLDLRLEAQSSSLPAATEPWGWRLPVDGQITVKARLGGDLATLALSDVSAEVSGSGGDHLALSGSLADVWAGSGLEGRITLKLDPAGPLANALPQAWRRLTQIEAAANVAGSVAAPVLDQIAADLRGPGDSRLSLAGTLQAATTDGVRLESFDLSSTLMVPDPSAFADRLGFDPAALGALQGDAELTLADRRIEAKRLRIDATGLGALRLEGNGALATLAADGTIQLAPDVALAAELTESGPLLALLDPSVPELGPAHATGRLVGDDQGYQLQELVLDLGRADNVAIHAQGKIGPLVANAAPATTLDLAVRFGWPSSRFLEPLIGAELSELGKAEGNLGLDGTLAGLRIHDAHLATRSEAGLTVTATGGIASVPTAPPFAVEGIAFDLDARAPSTTLLARHLGHEVPDVGAVRAQAKLIGGPGPMALTAIELVAGPAAARSIVATGAIGDVLAFEKVELKGTFEVPTNDLLALADIHGKSDVGKLQGQIHLSDADGSMGFEHLDAEIRETRLLALTIEGVIDDLPNLDEVKFQTSLDVPSVDALTAVFDADGAGLERFRFDGKLSGNDRQLVADGRAILGATEVDGNLTGNFKGARPSFKANLRSPRVRLVDFGLAPAAAMRSTDAAEGSAPADPATASAPPQLFGPAPIPLDGLRKFDLDLDVQLDSLEGVVLAVDKAQAQITLTEGKLQLSQMRFDVARGYAEVNAEVDVRPSPPQWRLQAATDELQLGDIWQQLQTDVPLSGEFDLVLDLQASGRSPRDLASSLAGDLSLALQRGRIQSRLFDLTTMNPIRWLVARSTRRGYAKIDCFVARFQADQGVAAARTLVLDTPNVLATGEGEIDFAREIINLRIHPRAKHSPLVELATPFAIRGSLAAPTVEAGTTGATARALGRVVFTPLNLLGSLLPFVSDHGGDQDNPCLTLPEPAPGTP